MHIYECIMYLNHYISYIHIRDPLLAFAIFSTIITHCKFWVLYFCWIFFNFLLKIPAGVAGYGSLDTLDTTPLDSGILMVKEKADCKSFPKRLCRVIYEYLIHPEDKIRTGNRKDTRAEQTFVLMLARAKAVRALGDLPRCPLVRIIWKKLPALGEMAGVGVGVGDGVGRPLIYFNPLNKDWEAPVRRWLKTSTS